MKYITEDVKNSRAITSAWVNNKLQVACQDIKVAWQDTKEIEHDLAAI